MVNYSIFKQEDTLCMRQRNSCKLRKKCKRYTTKERGKVWVANYWQEFGEFCDYFIKND